MNGSDSAKDASAQPPAPAAGASASNSNGNSAINKKRKKDGLKPIITTESPGYVHFPSSVPVCPATSPVVGFLVVRHPVPRQDMHIPLLMPHAKTGNAPGLASRCNVWATARDKWRGAVGASQKGKSAGGVQCVKVGDITARPIRSIQRPSSANPHRLLGPGHWAEENQRFPAAALVVAPACCSSLQRHTTPQNPPHTAPSAPPRLPATTTTNLRANLGQPHDAQFACRYPRDPSFTPFTQPRLRPRPRAGAGATESKMRTMLHNKTRSPLLLCARPVSAFHRGSAGGIPLSRGVGAALKVRHRAPAQLNPNPATLTRAAAAALALLHLASPNRAHATAF